MDKIKFKMNSGKKPLLEVEKVTEATWNDTTD